MQDKLFTRSFLFLSRWSLATALTILVPLAVYIGGGGFTAAESVPGPGYNELLRAPRIPILSRVGTGAEALYWLMIGATFIICAGLFARRAPIQATLIAMCGPGQLIGSLGAFLRLNGIGDLAALYSTAATNQQAALLQSFLDLNRAIQPHYTASTLLQGVGFLLVGRVALSIPGFPRWLAIWLVISGSLGLALFAVLAAGAPVSLFLSLAVIGLVSAHLSMAVGLWHPSSALESLGIVYLPASRLTARRTLDVEKGGLSTDLKNTGFSLH